MEEVASLVVDWIVKQRNRDPFISASCRAQPTRSPHMTGYAIEADKETGTIMLQQTDGKECGGEERHGQKFLLRFKLKEEPRKDDEHVMKD